MKFNINDFPGIDDAMYCQTEEEAYVFTQYLHSLGRKWRGGTSYEIIQRIDTNYPSNGVSYFFNQNAHGEGKYNFLGGITLCFEDFEWDICLDLCPCEEEQGLINEFLLSFCIAE